MNRKVLVGFLVGLAFAGASSAVIICVTLATDTGCIYYRSCCFEGPRGEDQGCWEMELPCQY
jgi:hypothetical protein